ncbi:ATP-binding cassette subfamily B (MDR/TAP) member 8 [Clonorchis sinensis]|uniref:ATP-binding cassette subfamily B (MDR/TAP) member 8 n=1 Tax=Clonorchis sinensis TaxID=79923 RepID=G7YIK8_CLOSI|nr:ATP-binding cassette subfamily B (MDR/TAP) member 8 [Clonorchis sinensis]
MNILIPIYLGEFVEAIALWSNRDGIPSGVLPTLKLFVAYVVQSVATFSYISLLASIGERIAFKLRNDLLKTIIHNEVAYFDTHNSGKLIDSLTADVQTFKSAFKQCISIGLRSTTQILGSFISLLSISPMLTGTLLSSLPCVFLIGSLMGAELRRLSQKAQSQVLHDSRRTELLPERTQSFISDKLYEQWSQPGHAPDLQFDAVRFAYPTRPEAVVLDELNLSVPAGNVVALVGQSGAGKSTVVSLIERFYNPSSGRITLGSHDLRDFSLPSLRGQLVGYISQEPQIFNTSIRENIRLGKPDATDQQVEEAARLANAHDFIVNQLPKGYETRVGQGSDSVAGLSGGQRQRIAIARVILKNSPFLILDEATSALDAESEAQVQEALKTVMKGCSECSVIIVIAAVVIGTECEFDRSVWYWCSVVNLRMNHVSSVESPPQNLIKGRTVLVIAHRLSTVRGADWIIVMSHGKVAEISRTYQFHLASKINIHWKAEKQRFIPVGNQCVYKTSLTPYCDASDLVKWWTVAIFIWSLRSGIFLKVRNVPMVLSGNGKHSVCQAVARVATPVPLASKYGLNPLRYQLMLSIDGKPVEIVFAINARLVAQAQSSYSNVRFNGRDNFVQLTSSQHFFLWSSAAIKYNVVKKQYEFFNGDARAISVDDCLSQLARGQYSVRRVHTKGQDDFGQFIQKQLHLFLLSEDKNNVFTLDIDKVFARYLKTEVQKTYSGEQQFAMTQPPGVRLYYYEATTHFRGSTFHISESHLGEHHRPDIRPSNVFGVHAGAACEVEWSHTMRILLLTKTIKAAIEVLITLWKPNQSSYCRGLNYRRIPPNQTNRISFNRRENRCRITKLNAVSRVVALSQPMLAHTGSDSTFYLIGLSDVPVRVARYSPQDLAASSPPRAENLKSSATPFFAFAFQIKASEVDWSLLTPGMIVTVAVNTPQARSGPGISIELTAELIQKEPDIHILQLSTKPWYHSALSALTKVAQRKGWARHVVAPTRHRAGQLSSFLDSVITNERHFFDQLTKGDKEDELAFRKIRNRCKSETHQWNTRKQAAVLDLARKNKNVLFKYMSTTNCGVLVMCYACRNIVYRDERCSPCFFQNGANCELDNAVLPAEFSRTHSSPRGTYTHEDSDDDPDYYDYDEPDPYVEHERDHDCFFTVLVAVIDDNEISVGPSFLSELYSRVLR